MLGCGILQTMNIQLQDFDRQVVKSDYATLFIPAIEFEQPPSKRGGTEWLLALINVFFLFQAFSFLCPRSLCKLPVGCAQNCVTFHYINLVNLCSTLGRTSVHIQHHLG